MQTGPIALFASLLLSSCGATTGSAATGSATTGSATTSTPSYPSLAPKHQADESFTPAPNATRLVLPCAKQEPEVDNGLDDNCDGRVDHQPDSKHVALLITLSHPSLVDVHVALKPEPKGEFPPEVSREHLCEEGAPFAIQSLRLPDVPKGRYDLTVSHGASCGTDVSAPVNASVWLYGRLVGVFSVSLAADAPTVVGTLDVR